MTARGGCGMTPAMRLQPALLLPACLLAVACSGSDGETDAGTPDTGSEVDTGVNPIDAGTVPDSGPDPVDAGPEDTGVEVDGGGAGLDPMLMPGAFVQVAEGRVDVMQDSFRDVVDRLGAGTRTALANTRSYEWTLAGGVELTVWFANSNLDADDAPPNDVDDTDRVLWIAVQGGFTGTTPDGVGLGSTRAEVETALGTADNTVPVTDPAGTLLQYFQSGALIALSDADAVRTFTVHRAYNSAPDGAIDVDDGRLQFMAGNIEGQDGLRRGTDKSDVMRILGEPDAQGGLRVSGQDLDTWSYGFFGVELFFLDGRDTVLFTAVHTPFYGTVAGGTVGVGSTRADMEAFLGGEGYDGGRASNGNARFICYTGPRDVGITYSEDTPPLVTSITTPLLACP